MQNRYRSVCVQCGGVIPAKAGFMMKENGQWKCYHAEGQCETAGDPVLLDSVKFDDYQRAIIDAMLETDDNLLIKARAGSGKTTVMCAGFNEFHRRWDGEDLLLLSFGKNDACRLAKKLLPGVPSSTMHSFGVGLIKNHWRWSKMQKRKDSALMDSVIGIEGEDTERDRYRRYCEELISKAKADALLGDNLSGITGLVEKYSLDIPEIYIEKSVVYAGKCLELSLDVKKWGYNYDDMLYLVAVCDLDIPSYSFIGVDECQDLNECQLVILEKLANSGARLMAIGDPEQSLYLFRGAASDSFERVRSCLSGVELPMPICYRCSQSVIARAQGLVPDIEARPGAPIGSTDWIEMDYSVLTNKDMIICRTNVPLVRTALELIKLGIPFYMRKGEQEAGLLGWYIRFWGGSSLEEMLENGRKWLGEIKAGGSWRAGEHSDRFEVIELLSMTCTDIRSLQDRIKEVFCSSANSGVMLSSIHQAKGSEAERVYHIRRDLCPHPRAKSSDELKQEQNALYVAITRAIMDYYEVVNTEG